MSRSKFWPMLVLVLGVMAIAARSDAAALPASYTVTDLGPVGSSPDPYTTYGPAATVGRQTITSTDGQTVYAFPRSTILAPDGLLASIPAAVPASNWDWAFHGLYTGSQNLGPGLLTADGSLYAVNRNGVGGAGLMNQSVAFAVQRLPSGSFGSPQLFYSTPNESGIGFSTNTVIFDVNKQGVMIGSHTPYGGAYPRELLIFDSKTGTSIPFPLQAGGYYLDRPIAIDDDGRILTVSQASNERDLHELLLTPAGVSSDPIATPEPSTLVILGGGAVGCWWRRRARRVARSS